LTPGEFRQVKEIFVLAAQRRGAERSSFLDQAFGRDPGLRREVESLLEHDEALSGFLENPAPAAPALRFATDMLPPRIGSYTILGRLGTGGMGIVYQAQQDRPRRVVALKVLPLALASAERLRRFEYEVQVLARLQDPGIAQIFEAGSADSADGRQPFFTMELVRGEPITAYASSRPLSIRQRLELLARTCDAVQYAHQRGVIHRDLKPDNILVDENGQPKILDFGVARLTDPDQPLTTLLTGAGQLVGTLSYMSPEQLAGDPHEVDVRSDVYALGVVAYELLSGRPPYELSGRSLPEAMQVIREHEPPPLSAIARAFRGDLTTLVAKALAKDRKQRYQSAADLAADVRRYLRVEPLLARPAGKLYRLSKFARRHKALVAGVSAVFLALLAGAAGTTWQAQVARAGRAQAEQEAARAQQVQRFLEQMLASVDPDVARGRDVTVLREILDSAAARVGTELAGQPLVAADVEFTIGNTYFSLGLYEQAEAHLRAALDTRRRLLGDTHADVAACQHKLGSVLMRMGRSAEAESLLRAALATRRRVLGSEQIDVAATLNALGELLYEQQIAVGAREHLADVERVFDEALTIYRKQFGDRHAEVARTLKNLALVAHTNGDLARAEELYRQALDILQAVSGEESRPVATLLYQLGALLDERGDAANADALLRRALNLYEALLGPEHEAVGTSSLALGRLLSRRGDFAGAEPLIRRALAIRRQTPGDQALNVADILSLLGRVLEGLERLPEADAAFREALELYTASLPNDHAWVGIATANRARVLGRRGEAVESERLWRTALSIFRKSLGDTDWRTTDALTQLGACLTAQNRFGEAEPLLVEGVGALLDSLQTPQDRKQQALARIIALYEAWGKPEQAAAWQAKLPATRPAER
jgi:serine/threonine protein kinase/Tfp pilus assembly protein PilF